MSCIHRLLASLLRPLRAPGLAIAAAAAAFAQPPASVVIVAPASPEWACSASVRITAQLEAALPARYEMRVLLFDAAPEAPCPVRSAASASPASLRDTIASGLAALREVPARRAMIVIARDEFAPTTLSPKRLLAAAVESEAAVHSIHLAPPAVQRNVWSRFGRTVARGVVRLSESLVYNEAPSLDAAATRRLQRQLAHETGGQVCVADERTAESACVQTMLDALR